YLDAFLQLVYSPTRTDALFSVVYDELRFDRFRFDRATVDQLMMRLPGAVAMCMGAFRCNDWRTFILEGLLTGEMFLCPPTSGQTEAQLLTNLPYGDYYCVEDIAAALPAVAVNGTVPALLNLSATHSNGWSRRNGLRVIGRFGERPMGDAARTMVVSTHATAVTTGAEARLASDLHRDVLADAIWILDSFFLPYFAMQPELQAISANMAMDDDIRFRAMAAIQRLIYSKSGLLPSGDVSFIVSSLSSDDGWVRAEAAYICEALRNDQLDGSIRMQLVSALQARYAVETFFTARVYEARALDRFNGSMLLASLRAEFETQHLGNFADGGTLMIRSGLDAGHLPGFLQMMADERSAFFDILGPTFTTPVPGDTNASMTLMLFANPTAYQDYMSAFIGYGASAGGLYLEDRATLYTYERSPAQSTYTVQELIKHELGHYLQGRYVYPGLWGAPGYHDQPKGWADEGFAEVLGGLSFDGGTYTIHGRPLQVGRICASMPFRTIPSLIAQRTGYDQAGVFDYDNGWALNWFLFVRRKPQAVNLFTSLRNNTYTQGSFATIAGVPMTTLQTDWHAELSQWCTTGGPPGPGGAPPPLLTPLPAASRSPCRSVERLTSAPPPGPPQR
ncbi:MAG: collagenase, partial [Myxococcaceae bacterium]|nr:collagenase [Myxococcaceae bacterium]